MKLTPAQELALYQLGHAGADSHTRAVPRSAGPALKPTVLGQLIRRALVGKKTYERCSVYWLTQTGVNEFNQRWSE